MSNTQKRVFFGVLMAAIALTCLLMGAKWVLGLMAVVGVLTLDELFCNFFDGKRFSLFYFISQLIYLLPFVYFNFVDVSPGLMSVFYNAGMLVSFIFVIYLFAEPFEQKFVLSFGKKIPFIASGIVLFPMMSLSSIFIFNNWVALLTVFLFINFGMDTGAWFFGKNFGKHKLWKAISPNKTIEGLIGGAFTSGILGSLTWYLFFDSISLKLLALFSFLGLISHLGDLIQSKLKRQKGIKDSSGLIPGHGGAYDRIDSLIFLAPFYAAVLKYIYIN